MDTIIQDKPNTTVQMPCTLAIATVPSQPWSQPYDCAKALSVGTIFPNLHMPFFGGGDADASVPCKLKEPAGARDKMLREIDEAGFAVNDITLYLDTHPEDTEAIAYFKQHLDKRNELLKQFAAEFDPLIMNDVSQGSNGNHWTWADGPMPWEGGTN